MAWNCRQRVNCCAGNVNNPHIFHTNPSTQPRHALPTLPADNPPLPLSLVGDLKNTFPQWRRGGGGVVVQHPHLNEALRLMVVDVGDT